MDKRFQAILREPAFAKASAVAGLWRDKSARQAWVWAAHLGLTGFDRVRPSAPQGSQGGRARRRRPRRERGFPGMNVNIHSSEIYITKKCFAVKWFFEQVSWADARNEASSSARA
jgi:hypothetical protein